MDVVKIHENEDDINLNDYIDLSDEIVEDISMVTPFIINNCVVTYYIGRLINLNKLIIHLHASKYNPKVFAALEINLYNPKCIALIFTSGRFVILGCKTLEATRLVMCYFIDIFENIGINTNIQLQQYNIQNIVSSTYVGKKLNLRKIYNLFQKESSYEESLFPGLTFRPSDTKMILLIFNSGKIVLTGSRHISDLKKGYNILLYILNIYNNTLDKIDK
jgi:transcription initiation factor TFIID TATA-box-binding protein